MAITSTEQTAIMKTVSALFNKAFTPETTTKFFNFYESNGKDLSKLADGLIGSASYEALYAGAGTIAEYGAILMAKYNMTYGGTSDADTKMTNFIKYSFDHAADNNSLRTIQAVDKYITATLLPSVTTGNVFETMNTAIANKAEVAITFKNNPSNAGKELSLVSVTSDPATKDTANSSATTGQTFNLTTGVDSIVGGAGNDTINAVQAGTAFVLGALDTIDGGAGVDTLNVQDTTTAAGSFSFGAATIKNVENINVTTNGDFTLLNTTAITGLTSFTGKAAGTAATTLTVADTTDVNLTLGTTNISTVTGGKAVSVTKGDASAGTLGISGKALTTVTVKDGAAAVTIDNKENSVAATSNKGTTLTSVILDSVDADAGIGGEGLTSVTLKGVTTAARTTTVTNAKAAHEMTVNVDGTGYKADATAVQSVFVDSVAKTITVNATGAKSSLSLAGSTSATTVNVTGTADLTLLALASATTLDGSKATGSLTLGAINAATVTVKTGSGNDTLAINATAKTTVDSGAGNDIVTLTSALAAGSTVNLGDGNDTLLGTTVVATSTVSAVTVIDGGAGTDSVSSALINAGNAAQFVNFENISLQGATLDLALMTKSTITGLSIDAAATTVVSNATTAQSLTVNATGTSSTIGFTGVTALTDAYTISFAATTTGTIATPTTINAGTVVVNGIESLTINSGATAGVNANQITLTDNSLQTVKIDGSQDLKVSFTGTNGTIVSTVGGVSLIDGSTATGKLDISIANITAAAAGITVKGGSAVDKFTTDSFSSTLTGNGGNDNFVVYTTDSNVTAGAGAAQAAVIANTLSFTTITDFTKGDTITLATSATSNTFTTAKIDVSAATNLGAALDIAASSAAAAAATSLTKWFVWGEDSYLVQDRTNTTTLDTTDIVVKLNGVTDLSTSSITADVLTFA